MTYDPYRDNTTIPAAMTVAGLCTHGLPWGSPCASCGRPYCASCGRPYQAAPEVHYHGGADPITRRLLLLIARCLVEMAPRAAGRYQAELERIEADMDLR